MFGGIDYANDGSYGSNYKLGEYLETAVQSKEYNIPLQKGDTKIVNSPLFSNESGGKDVYREILDLVKDNFNTKNGTLILYGYSWGRQLMLEFLKYFKESGINITLLITVDAAKGYFSFSVNNDITDNVKYNLNMYQTKFYKSAVWSRGWPNEGGNKVKKVNLTEENTPSGDAVIHSNIDDYTLLYCTQVILYALKGVFSFNKFTESEIKSQIKLYASKGL